MKFQIYRGYSLKGRVWRWRLRAANGEIIANGGQGYSRLIDCRGAVNLVRGASLAPIEEEPAS